VTFSIEVASARVRVRLVAAVCGVVMPRLSVTPKPMPLKSIVSVSALAASPVMVSEPRLDEPAKT
jgi:hypothetical protein